MYKCHIFNKNVYIYHQKTCTRMFTAALLVTMQALKQSKCPSILEQMKCWCTCDWMLWSRDQETFFLKGQIVNIFRFGSYTVSAVTKLCHRSAKALWTTQRQTSLAVLQ